MMEFLGFVFLVLSGFLLGFMGGGGALLTLPVLVEFFSLPVASAVRLSLLLVALTSFMGALFSYKRISWDSVLFFSLLAFPAVFLGKRVASYVPSALQLAVFLLVLLFVFFKPKKNNPNIVLAVKNSTEDFLLMFLTGFLMGFVGVGGGFLIMPVLLRHHIASVAVPSSLAIIALSSSAGFFSFSDADVSLNFFLLLASFSLMGVLLGRYLLKKSSAKSFIKIWKGLLFCVILWSLYKLLFLVSYTL
jgi:uncharacterized membrane protein YfcA